ncbi:MAG: GntR family transcriptional regulator [Kiloniellales bacterium]|nr:GntR family transcriptional regulator [Kiloniellales bacterium]
MDAALTGDNRLPRYQRLAETIKRAISHRRWRPGERLPSEQDLALHFTVAPGTVRQAITQLVDEGLLERHQGKGTFVRKPSFDSSLFRFFRFHGTDEERRVPESEILRREAVAPPPAVAETLQLAPEATVISMARLRLLDGEPVLAEQIWLPFDRFKALLDLEDAEIGPLLYPIYEEACGEIVARAEEELTAEACSNKHAQLLKLKKDTPVIVIDRTAFGYDDTPLELRSSRGRADKFQYHIEIR